MTPRHDRVTTVECANPFCRFVDTLEAMVRVAWGTSDAAFCSWQCLALWASLTYVRARAVVAGDLPVEAPA